MSEPQGAEVKLDALKPRELVELLDRMNPEDIAARNIDVDAIGRAIDPRKLRKNELSALLSAITRLAEAGADVDLSRMRPGTFARIITHASREQIQAVMADPRLRTRVIDEIFRRAGEHVRPERVRDLDAVVHWRLTDGTGAGGYDRWETVFADAACTVSRDMAHKPKVTITLTPADFLKLITQNASAPVLFLTGKLKVRGDLAFAASLSGLFDLPRG
ncbi:SCP2 sterol-binding domain-containing protein [Actinokineospora fastidiosa]|uniref:Sterol-binding protein n=1 Tax=Actinokineospora fastidiosa TaxID=1816 RepID=A0A918L906_9PSEU|nr:SCP2 sterol-binding domain-containing protein [Actinokineospora fastidiosa]GGS19892.1 sterol-binding protein [Actinokineospora fastidiosa]